MATSFTTHPGCRHLRKNTGRDVSVSRVRMLKDSFEGSCRSFTEEGRSEILLDKFYDLLLLMRRQHQFPPQPRDWFRNLFACLGEQIKIGVASKDGQPIASILTLSYKGSLVYKYGCSDARFHNLGGMSFLPGR